MGSSGSDGGGGKAFGNWLERAAEAFVNDEYDGLLMSLLALLVRRVTHTPPTAAVTTTAAITAIAAINAIAAAPAATATPPPPS